MRRLGIAALAAGGIFLCPTPLYGNGPSFRTEGLSMDFTPRDSERETISNRISELFTLYTTGSLKDHDGPERYKLIEYYVLIGEIARLDKNRGLSRDAFYKAEELFTLHTCPSETNKSYGENGELIHRDLLKARVYGDLAQLELENPTVTLEGLMRVWKNINLTMQCNDNPNDKERYKRLIISIDGKIKDMKNKK